jgi:hypothetical protein
MHAGLQGEGGAARGFATRSRAALGINPSALGPGREVHRWTSGQAGMGNAHSTDRPRPRKHGLRLSRGRLRVPLARTAVERR